MTENYTGLKNGYILIGQESTWGTAVSADKDVGIVTDLTPSLANETISSRGMSAGRNIDQFQIGNWRLGFDITTEFQHGRLIEYALGAVAHDGSDPYTHTFTESNDLPSFTAEIGLDGTVDDTETHEGCKINEYTLALDLGGVVTQRAVVMSEDLNTGTSASAPVVDTLTTLPWGVASFSVGAASSEVAVAQCRAMEWTMTNGMDGDNDVRAFGSYKAQQFIEGARDYSARVTLAFTDANERGRFLGGATNSTTPASADFSDFSCIFEVDKAAENRRITLTMNDVRYINYRRPFTVGGLIIQEIDIRHKSAGIVSEDDISGGNW